MKAIVNTFIGVDLGWYGKPSGLASISWDGRALTLRRIARLSDTAEIVGWILKEAGSSSAVTAVDAPLIIRNHTGIRPAERELNRDFRRFQAGCHPANPGRPFAANVIAFSDLLENAGFRLGRPSADANAGGFRSRSIPMLQP